MTIRLAGADDLPRLQPLVSFYATETAAHGTERNDDLLMQAIAYGIAQRQAVVVAEQDDGQLIGWCAWVALPASPPGKVEGLGTWTDPRYRRDHVSRDMRRFAEKRARELGYLYVDGVAALGNEAALQSVIRAGFRIVGYLTRKDFGDGQEERAAEAAEAVGLLKHDGPAG